MRYDVNPFVMISQSVLDNGNIKNWISTPKYFQFNDPGGRICANYPPSRDMKKYISDDEHIKFITVGHQ